MKLRNSKLVKKVDGATPSQQCSNGLIQQDLVEDLMIISICEDNGEIEIIASKDMETSHYQKETTDNDLIFVEEICSSRAKSNPRKRKRSDEEDVKVLDEVEIERDVIFVEEVTKSKILCDEIVIPDTQNQEPKRDTAEASSIKQPSLSNTSTTCVPPVVVQPRRLFVNPQHAASDIVEKLVHLGEQRVCHDQHGPIPPQEFHMIMGVKFHWLAAKLRRNMVDNETNQEFCWRVRRFTKGALLNVARQMSQYSSLAWAIVANNKDHTIQFLNKKSSLHSVPVQAKNETQDPSNVKADASQQSQRKPDLLPDLNKVKKEKEEKES